MQDYQAIDVHIDEHLDQHVDELSKLCAIPSVAAQNIGMEEGASLVAEMLRRRGFETQILPTDGQPVVYAAISGAADKTLIFYNHYDVQPAEPLELWNSSPFEATLNDGMLIARGVSDDKGHIQCRLAALDAILETEGELPCNIKFLIEGEEEIGSINLPVFIENNKDLLAADVCLWEFGRINHQGRSVQDAGLRGICYVELSVSTAKQDAHSGIGGSIFPNAAWRLTWALGTLKDENEHILIPGFYDKVLPPSEYDLELLGELPEASASYKETYGIEGF